MTTTTALRVRNITFREEADMADREAFQRETIYVTPDGTASITPDGVGRYFYDTVADARAEHE